MSKIRNLLKTSDLELTIDALINPKKHLKRLPLERIVADTKIHRPGVERYKRKIANGDEIAPIIVVKHPTKNVYAVLDGHHRYHAYLELGTKEIDCALTGNVSTAVFHATQLGLFQPHPEVTKRLRVPALRLHAELEQFLLDFQKNPYGLRELLKEQIKRMNSRSRS